MKFLKKIIVCLLTAGALVTVPKAVRGETIPASYNFATMTVSIENFQGEPDPNLSLTLMSGDLKKLAVVNLERFSGSYDFKATEHMDPGDRTYPCFIDSADVFDTPIFLQPSGEWVSAADGGKWYIPLEGIPTKVEYVLWPGLNNYGYGDTSYPPPAQDILRTYGFANEGHDYSNHPLEIEWFANARVTGGMIIMDVAAGDDNPTDDVLIKHQVKWKGGRTRIPGVGEMPWPYEYPAVSSIINGSEKTEIVTDVWKYIAREEQKVPPLVGAAPLTLRVGQTAADDYFTTGSITAAWGFSANRPIPPYGTLTVDELDNSGQDPYFSGEGPEANNVIKYIGSRKHHITATDSSSAPNPPDPEADITKTTRTVTATTDEAPALTGVVAAGAAAADGETLHESSSYSPAGANPGGGIEGWCKWPITVTADSTGILGHYDLRTAWLDAGGAENTPATVEDESVTAENLDGAATKITAAFADPAVSGADGWLVRGVCTVQGDADTELSKASELELKYDNTLPDAALALTDSGDLEKDGGGHYINASSDALSGLQKTEILFAAVGSDPPEAASGDWQDLGDYRVPTDKLRCDVYVKATDKAGNRRIQLAKGDAKVNDTVQASLDTDKGAAVHTPGCPNENSPATSSGCYPACHNGTGIDLTEGSTFHYIYTLTSDGEDAEGAFANYLPRGVEPIDGSFTVTSPTGGGTEVTGTVSDGSGAHAGQKKLEGSYTLKTADSVTLTFEVECRAPLYGYEPGADNVLANEGGSVDYTMSGGFSGTSDLNSAVHRTKALENQKLTLKKTVTGKYGRHDQAFAFRLSLEHSWGAKVNGSYGYTKTDGAAGDGASPVTGSLTVRDGVLEEIDGEEADHLSLKHGDSIVIDVPQGCRFGITEEAVTGYTATEQVDGAAYTHATEGVVNGTIETADRKVEYFNRNDFTAPVTGIAGPGSGMGLLAAVAAGILALGAGLALLKRKQGKRKQKGAAGLVILTLVLTAPALGGTRVQAAAAAGGGSVPRVEQTFDIQDGTPSGDRFFYHMTPVTPGAPLPGGASGEYGFSLSGDGALLALPETPFAEPGTYVYELSRVKGGELAGYAYDDGVWTAEAYVAPGPAGLTADWIMKDPEGYKCPGAAFAHSYQPLESDPSILVDPPVKKQVDGKPDKAGSFRFSLTAEKKTSPMPEGSQDGKKELFIAGEGEEDFGTWSYTHTGTYRYTVAEVNVGEAGYTYDRAVYTITDVVSDENGALKVERTVENQRGEPAEAYAFTNRYEGKQSSGFFGQGLLGLRPKTGDGAPLLLLAAAVVVSGALLLYLRHRRRGSEKEEKKGSEGSAGK